MKILVLGHKGHGKTTTAKLLRDMYDLKYADSSMFLCEKVVYPALKDKYGYASPAECHADRDNHRPEWYRLLQEYNTPDKARLTRELLAENDVYAGLRARDEFWSTCHLYDLILWCDASDTKPLEPESSMTIKYDPDIMTRLDCNGSVHDLVEQLTSIMSNYITKD